MNDTRPSTIRATEPLDDGLLLSLSGDIDLSNSPDLRAGLIKVSSQKPSRLIIDMSGVPYMDSSGVATLVEALQQQRKHQGKLILCGLQAKVKGIFEIARLNTVFTIVDNLDDAKSA